MEDSKFNEPRVTVEIGGYGTAPGRLLEPVAAAISPDARIYIADRGSHRIVVFGQDGKFLKQWGRPGTQASEFWGPSGIAVAPNGEVYVVDTGNDRVQVFDRQGKFLRAFGQTGTGEGEFSAPISIAATDDLVEVLERDHPRVQRFSPLGVHLLAFGSFGDKSGQFKEPAGIALDEHENTWVLDGGTSRVLVFDSKGSPVNSWGYAGSAPGMMSSPGGIAVTNGSVLVADTNNHRVQTFLPGGQFQTTWGELPSYAHDGNGRLHFPGALAVSNSGLMVVCEPLEYRAQVVAGGAPIRRPPAPSTVLSTPPMSKGLRKVAPKELGVVLEPEDHSIMFLDPAQRGPFCIARAGGFGTRLGEFNHPAGCVQDHSSGRFFVSERASRRLQLLELVPDPVSPSGLSPNPRFIASWDVAALLPQQEKAPTSCCGQSPGTGPRSERCCPGRLALDSQGRLLVVDEGNGYVLMFGQDMKFVRSIPLPSAFRPGQIADIALNPDGTQLLILERNSCSVLHLDLQGNYLLSWGRRGLAGDDGFLSPSGIAVDAEGSIYVSDALLNDVRKFDFRGKLLARWGEPGQEPEFHSPRGVWVVKPNLIIVDDFGNHCARVISPNGIETIYKGARTP